MMRVVRVSTAAVVLVLACTQAFCQHKIPQETQEDILRRAEQLVTRTDMRPRQSMEGVPGIDTLDTTRPDIKIVLYADNTWYYYKDHTAIMNSDLFTTYWDSEMPNPYDVSLNDLPLRTTIVLAQVEGEFKCPYQGSVYSKFGYRRGRRHQGVDLPFKYGTPVAAAFAGKVRVAKRYAAYGNLVVIRHQNGLETFYGHLSKINVSRGDWVEAGDIIGLGGSTGRSTGPHLHFETRYKGYAFDPQWIIDFERGSLRASMFTLKKKYLSAGSRYVQSELDDEIEIHKGDSVDFALLRQREIADSLAAVEAAKAQYHTIRQGDTLSGIARRYNTTLRNILRLNPGMTENTILQIGRKVRVR